MDKTIRERLKKHPHLEKYVAHYIRTNDLIIWFREMFAACGYDDTDVPTVCGWDDEMAEDFWSWGHNSRWYRVFDAWLSDDIERGLRIAFDTMDECGKSDFDFDVEEEDSFNE